MRVKYLLILLLECLAVLLCIHSFGQGTVLLTPGAQIKTNNGAYFVLDNMHLVNNGIIQQSTGDCIFKFTGANDVTLSGTGTTVLSKIYLNKQTNSKLTSQCNISVVEEIRFTGGLFNLDNYTVDLGNSGVLTNESEASRAYSNGTGYLQARAALDHPVAANPGNLGASISASQDLGFTLIRRGHSAQNNVGTGKSILRYFDIIPSNDVSLHATLRFFYLDAELNNLSESTLSVFKSDDNVNWAQVGNDSRDLSQNFVEKISIDQFSRWTLGSSGVALPVTGLLLTGFWQDDATLLKWSTLAEYGNHYFDVERKYQNENAFVFVARKFSLHPGGNAQTTSRYSWTDSSVVSNRGPVQYRLRQVDLNGRSSLSNVVMIKPEPNLLFISKLFPSVVESSEIYVHTGNLDLKNMRIQIFDENGKLCGDLTLPYQSQWIRLPYLSAGMYRLVFNSGSWLYKGTMMKQ